MEKQKMRGGGRKESTAGGDEGGRLGEMGGRKRRGELWKKVNREVDTGGWRGGVEIGKKVQRPNFCTESPIMTSALPTPSLTSKAPLSPIQLSVLSPQFSPFPSSPFPPVSPFPYSTLSPIFPIRP
ncbi:hypothetical protein Pcinc_037761 [Petrolisthes cinctipes]|uniref:Uncharacterized protein n=1 Tax=Petrolisthes cinctipes TaxID=88211 RepID=A0AAE1BS93_PETCI|nr:hypothetical protein Pcinc_037761 [Petrolisthes cinctipes]